MANTQKDTIYIDIDDEITTIIDKVKSAEHKIVALVLPKRATVLKSIVNMKLLKKSAVAANKSLVLITSEAGLLPLAGAVGVHVAHSLQSKPAIPLAPEKAGAAKEEVISEAVPEPAVDTSKPVGELAGAAAAEPDEDDSPIELDNEDPALKANQKPSKPFNKKLKVPNFEKFRLKFVILGAVLLLGGFGALYAFVIAPRAIVDIVTDSTTVPLQIQMTASTKLKESDLEKKQLAAVVKKVKKTDSEKMDATGEKDLGEKAAGTMTLTNCIDDGAPHTVPAGTTFTDNGISFVSDEAVDLDPALYSGPNCKSEDFGLSKSVPVTAASAGDKYNLSARGYTASITGIRAAGSAMSGGTTKIVKVVSRSDVEGAVAKLKNRQDEAALAELKALLKADGAMAIDGSEVIADPKVSATPGIDKEGESTTVTAVTEYTLTGINLEELKKVVTAEIEKQIDKSKQSILEDGIADAEFRIDSEKDGAITVTLNTEALAGPQLDKDTIRNQIRGMKRGAAEQLIADRPGIKEVTIRYEPFWVLSTPKSAKKITVNFDQPATTNKSDDNQQP